MRPMWIQLLVQANLGIGASAEEVQGDRSISDRLAFFGITYASDDVQVCTLQSDIDANEHDDH